MNIQKAPQLEHHSGSWIISSLQTGEAIFETFERRTAEAVNLSRYRVETAAQYLGRLNKEIKAVMAAQ